MKDLPLIVAIYNSIDQGFDKEHRQASRTGDRSAATRIERNRLVNDQAYFVLCWGQIEAEIDDACRTAIRRRQSNASWEMRRGFDFYNPDDRRLLSFERRVAIVLDRSSRTDDSYARVMQYYDTRNRIAHGRLGAQGIELAEVIADFYTIQASINR